MNLGLKTEEKRDLVLGVRDYNLIVWCGRAFCSPYAVIWNSPTTKVSDTNAQISYLNSSLI